MVYLFHIGVSVWIFLFQFQKEYLLLSNHSLPSICDLNILNQSLGLVIKDEIKAYREANKDKSKAYRKAKKKKD